LVQFLRGDERSKIPHKFIFFLSPKIWKGGKFSKDLSYCQNYPQFILKFQYYTCNNFLTNNSTKTFWCFYVGFIHLILTNFKDTISKLVLSHLILVPEKLSCT
jgi:hypothetical protein